MFFCLLIVIDLHYNIQGISYEFLLYKCLLFNLCRSTFSTFNNCTKFSLLLFFIVVFWLSLLRVMLAKVIAPEYIVGGCDLSSDLMWGLFVLLVQRRLQTRVQELCCILHVNRCCIWMFYTDGCLLFSVSNGMFWATWFWDFQNITLLWFAVFIILTN